MDDGDTTEAENTNQVVGLRGEGEFSLGQSVCEEHPGNDGRCLSRRLLDLSIAEGEWLESWRHRHCSALSRHNSNCTTRRNCWRPPEMQTRNVYRVSLTSGSVGAPLLCWENPLRKWVLRIARRFTAGRRESPQTPVTQGMSAGEWTAKGQGSGVRASKD